MLVDVIANAKDYEKSLIKKGRQEGRQQGKQEGKKEERIKNAKSLLDVLDVETIAEKFEMTVEEVAALKTAINSGE